MHSGVCAFGQASDAGRRSHAESWPKKPALLRGEAWIADYEEGACLAWPGRHARWRMGLDNVKDADCTFLPGGNLCVYFASAHTPLM